jgi:hypothetical protein
LRRDNVGQCEPLDRPAVEPAVADQARRELAPDHSGGARDQNVHGTPAAELVLQRHAAVDEMRLAGNVARLIAGEEEGKRGHFLRRPQPPHRLTIDKGLPHDAG